MRLQLAAPLAIVLTTSAAMAQPSRPDPGVTPGATNWAVTQFTIATTICSSGWAHSVRPPRKYTSYLKRRQLRALAWPDQSMRDYEEDHLILLELGGASADRRNLWPEPRHPADGWTAEQKDQLESALHRAVYGGTLSLCEAQRAIASDWPAAYTRFVGDGGGRPVCGRFASQLPPELLRRAFAAVGDIPNTPPSWNVAPTQAALVVRRHPETGERRLDALRWGLVPHFTKNLKACKRPINARSESIASSGMFRSALASRRCLVPADVFYEWKTVHDGKQPYAIARTDGAPLAFAGLWESWRDPAGEVLRSFTIATTAANADMTQLHERMPVPRSPGGHRS